MKLLWRRALTDPGRAISVAWSLVRGQWIVLSTAMRGGRLQVGRNFRVYGEVEVRGPGRVILGDNVRTRMRVTLFTHDADATIRVGDRAFLNGTAIGCAREVTVGADAILARAHLLDTDFHSTRADRHSAEAPVVTRPVRIGTNVWVADQAAILAGTEVGDDSVVGYGAICRGAFPARAIIAGNPARVVRDVEPAPAAAGRNEDARDAG